MPVIFGTMNASLSDGGRYQDCWYRSLSLRTFLFEREDVRAVAAPSHKKCAPASVSDKRREVTNSLKLFSPHHYFDYYRITFI